MRRIKVGETIILTGENRHVNYDREATVIRIYPYYVLCQTKNYKECVNWRIEQEEPIQEQRRPGPRFGFKARGLRK